MDYTILNKIKSPDDVKKLDDSDLNVLCSEVRDCLINTVSKTGGHLASNLGVVELTVAIHRAFNCPDDSIIFDVGHQCYTHKLLTGRFDRFSTLRQENGISGFMRPDESEYDPFITGHSSNSISAAFGICKAKQLQNFDSRSIAIIGDGAMTGGMAYEALNNAGSGKNQLVVILNDNKMSISRNVGAFARYLSLIRTKPTYHRFKHIIENALMHVPVVGKSVRQNLFRSKTLLKNAIYHSNIFEDMGFNYLGPVDGHNLKKLNELFKIAKEQTRPVLIHAITVKGKGYPFAESSPKCYHGVSAFDVDEGSPNCPKNDFSAICGDELCRLAQNDDKICAITAAMTEGTGLYEFSRRFKSRFFDVGIAEEHAVTFASGLAAGGMRPVFVVYSSFLQRGYDQIIHDAAIAGLPLKLLVDRAGIVGDDGETHQGVFDVAFLKTIPGIKIYSPSYFRELKLELNKSIYKDEGISAVRYPRGGEPALPEDYTPTDEPYVLYGDTNADTVIVTYGRLFTKAVAAYQNLKTKGIKLCIAKLNRVYPLQNEFPSVIAGFKNVHFFEEGMQSGGIAEHLSGFLLEIGFKGTYKIHAINNQFVAAGTIDSCLARLCLDAKAMEEAVLSIHTKSDT